MMAYPPSAPAIGKEERTEKQCAVPGACQGNFNALATTLAGNAETTVYRLASSHGAVAPYTPGEMLFALPSAARP